MNTQIFDSIPQQYVEPVYIHNKKNSFTFLLYFRFSMILNFHQVQLQQILHV
ncbi:hypothetical protein Hanom_Chr04g00299541 [Helianthus anomalus]